MAATKSDISRWFDRATEQAATHMIVVCDTFNYDDYPVFVLPGEDPKQKAAEYDGKNMQQVMEVYAMHLSKDVQMTEDRAFHYDPAPAPTAPARR